MRPRQALVLRAASAAVVGLCAQIACAAYEVPNSAYNPPTNYYNLATNPASLKADLYTTISHGFNESTFAHTSALNGQNYGNCRYAARVLFKDLAWVPTVPDPSNHILWIYDRTSHDYQWDNAATWNREHSWPQSWIGVSASNGTVNAASDLFEVYPASTSGNGASAER